MNISSFSYLELAIVTTMLICWLLQIWFLLRRVRPLSYFKQCVYDNTHTPAASVIICAKNESENLKKFLPLVLSQDYPNFEVIVVNDCSEDDSEMVLAKLKEEYPKLYYTTIPVDRQFFHGKKLALTIGVKAAKFEHLVFTDADCKPASSKWLFEMMQGFSNPQKEIVIGFGGYEKTKGFISQLVRYDTFFAAIQYIGFALSGKPYMGVGRNLAYKKSLFIKNNGLKNHIYIASGDDDLFVQETATSKNVAVVISPDAQTISTSPKTIEEWRNQKSRHLTTNKYYKRGIKTELALEPLSRQIFWLLNFVLIIFNTFVVIVASAIATKIVLQTILWFKASKKLNQGNLFLTLLWFEFLHPLLLIWVYIGNIFRRNKNKWK